jgi:hypothetical protein
LEDRWWRASDGQCVGNPVTYDKYHEQDNKLLRLVLEVFLYPKKLPHASSKVAKRADNTPMLGKNERSQQTMVPFQTLVYRFEKL